MQYKKLIISLLLPQLAGGLGVFLMNDSLSVWYDILIKPAITPPNWLFGPVWFVLYVLMGVSAYIIWTRHDEGRSVQRAMNLYWLHLALNASWTPIFFGLQNISLALVTIIVLWVLILALIVLFRSISKIAAYLLIPYLLWVSIASYLNYSFWILN